MRRKARTERTCFRSRKGRRRASRWTATPPPELPEFQRRAQQLVRSGNLDEALAVYEAELKTSPDSVVAHNGAGVVLDLLGRTKEAKAHFNRAIDLAATPVAKANARRALAMSFAFYNDSANT